MTSTVRIDKWLWAARFFKTRQLAKKAIEGGKIRYDGQRVKTSKQVELGARLEVPQGWDTLEVTVEALSDQRRGAPEARLLYRETEASVARRESEAQQRKLANQAMQPPIKRPDKRERRNIQRFQRQRTEE
ncbi:S4 domain-containing protein [Salinicola sp. RZ23]|uniref:RNA-binding S4 domain-containing protein n=1 Tax=Salinicola sp. RZ23 TaxID=1949087 RepID=UPI000DA195A7|nr:S4 domain-containing protein [Salinicola sp. RZ23]